MMRNDSYLPRETSYFILRKLNVNDAEDVFQIFSDQDVIHFDQPIVMHSPLHAEKLILALEKYEEIKQALSWGIECKKTNKVIGTCGFKNWDTFHDHAEIGGNLSSLFWGKGLGKAALKSLLDYGFEKMNLNKIYCYTNENNTRANHIVNSINFSLDGVLRDHQKMNKEYKKVYLYSLLKKEYKNMLSKEEIN